MAEAVELTLADGSSEGGSGVSVDGDTVTINAAGTYRISGTLTSGSLAVDAPDDVVNLVLDGVDITAADVAAINVVEAQQVVVWLADGSDNVLADAAGAAVDETVEDSPNATLFSSANLWIAGDGTLAVTAHAADAITSKDTLVMSGGDVTVDAADDGVRGKDQLVITGGTLAANAQGDALRSDNESVTDEPDAAVGVIWIDGGALDLTAGSDAMDAARQVTVLGGDLTIAAGDDGIHSDSVLRIAGGTVDITESVEGIEGAYMYLSGGDVSVVATDDGINVSGGAEALAEETAESTDGTAAEPDAAAGSRPEGGQPPGDAPAGDQAGGAAEPEGQASTTDAVDDLASLTVSAMEGNGFGGPAEGDNGNRFLELSGGTYVVDTTSDGVDVNGSMVMTGGTLVVSGTENVRQGAIDVDDVFTITGGRSRRTACPPWRSRRARTPPRRLLRSPSAAPCRQTRSSPLPMAMVRRSRPFPPEGLGLLHLLLRCPREGSRLRHLGRRRGDREQHRLAGARRHGHRRDRHRHGRCAVGAIGAARTPMRAAFARASEAFVA
ncbi:hypothetical protein C6I20_16865 [Aeromicrobium sp. A1-2]|uniref:carbohydrate-binding domain-containing protein n=1 Tax=Aeromicrobium sp. A1-2 TaxID=2107713 RepID=UPI000E4A60AE|nr:carbohydrate-binding domain-containing protein [Aeromicrobium sp. A1-2]AXT86668.1 hypothetical protein C6I20_16865 [Aeromicrobium sp. A1-2]